MAFKWNGYHAHCEDELNEEVDRWTMWSGNLKIVMLSADFFPGLPTESCLQSSLPEIRQDCSCWHERQRARLDAAERSSASATSSSS